MKKTLIVICIIVFSLISAYWIKILIGINIFESYSFSKYIPFKYQMVDSTLRPESGDIIINESFNTTPILKRNRWYLWMREKGKVVRDYDTNGFRNSKCLLIKSNSDKSWSYSSPKFIQVKKGDVFSYKGFSNLQGENVHATFCLVSYNKDKNVIKWDYEKTNISQTNEISKIEKRFTVTDGISFIKFRITGGGAGKFRFDDIEFRKL